MILLHIFEMYSLYGSKDLFVWKFFFKQMPTFLVCGNNIGRN